MKKLIPMLFMLALSLELWSQEFSQELTQTIRGKVIDETSEITLPGATVLILNTEPSLGSITNIDGDFVIDKVPVGRHTVFISFIGYEPVTIPYVVVHTGKSNYFNVKLKESLVKLEEVVVVGERAKDIPLNEMAAVSARAFTVEETQRYAAGLDDPSRMATSFAGATNSSLGSNAIVVRGNAPKGVQWRVEGIEIPNPSHFAGSSTAGGGLVTILSSQVLGNSDFMTAAFPSEYGNALSGVFDMNLRKGNNQDYEHAFKAGLLGIDFASEGPLSKNKNASYLFNYRYSTLGLIDPLLPDDQNTTKYQDLSFKLNFPTKAGEFSFWGVGGNDFGKTKKDLITDPDEWETEEDFTDQEYGFNVGATGLSHKVSLSKKSMLKTSIVASANDAYWDFDQLNDQSILLEKSRVKTMTGTYSASSTLNHKFSSKVTNRTGLVFNQHFYDVNIREAEDLGQSLRTIVQDEGSTQRWQAFTQTKVRVSESFEFIGGVHSQYLALNEQVTLEPRASLRYNMGIYKSISLGYGNHSQMESAKIYFVQDSNGNTPNKDLKMGRAHHIVLSYDWAINENLRLKIEPYFQYLYDVPVIADSSFSMLNFEQDWFFDQALVNDGKGRNYGVDITFEKFFSNDFYYLVTGSIFESKYAGGDGVWRDTRFNRNVAFNVLGGKEWQLGASGNKWLSVNLGLTLMGGKKRSPLNEPASILAQEEILDENNAYSTSEPFIYNVDLTVSYRKNRPKYSTVIALEMKNMLGSADYEGYEYNYKQNAMIETTSAISIPNLSYKIEF
ncbi:MAG: carboxypeptidase-like regulatory domain-containing protein [Reichenbachiella sp.]|uniref:TonB-dependent receptor n=1 Tax=Reichenbachiella sp. TaxID=2184521 RepID=UPI0032660DE9